MNEPVTATVVIAVAVPVPQDMAAEVAAEAISKAQLPGGSFEVNIHRALGRTEATVAVTAEPQIIFPPPLPPPAPLPPPSPNPAPPPPPSPMPPIVEASPSPCDSFPCAPGVTW